MRRRSSRVSGVLAVLAAMLVGQQASAAADAPVEKPEGSVFVQCDGRPAGQTGAELAGRLLLIMATSGLAGAGEMPNKERRLTGAEAAAACDKAIASESIETRKVELALARAVHLIEAEDYQGALDGVRAVPTLAGEKAADRGFQRSLGLSAMEIEAAALLRLGRAADAEAIALRMADKSPYDILTVQRAARYVGLTPEMTPAKAAFYDRFVRLLPSALGTRSELRQWAGDYAGSAADMAALMKVRTSFMPENEADAAASPEMMAKQAVSLALAGKVDESAAVAKRAQSDIEAALRSGKALNQGSTVNQAEELLDFHRIIVLRAQGKVAEARTAFGAKSRWLAPHAPAVALMTEWLRQGASESELNGALARDPAQLRADGMAARAGAIIEDAKAIDILYGSIRTLMKESDYNPYKRAVWNTAKSNYLVKRKAKDAKDKYKGELIMVPSGATAATGEALLLHAALLAQARGKSGFMMMPHRKYLEASFVLVGNPEDPGMEPAAMFQSAEVVGALSNAMPGPAKR